MQLVGKGSCIGLVVILTSCSVYSDHNAACTSLYTLDSNGAFTCITSM